jgi:hypothetical protein
MDRSDVKELYYITPIANVPSIMRYGILSHNLSKNVSHNSVAMQEIQNKRIDKVIPGTDKHLHDYANFYFDAHNPMLSKVRRHNNEICVLRINATVLELPSVIISDQNAASGYARFYTTKDGLTAIDKDTIFAPFWLHPENLVAEWRHGSAKCAEVLIPQKVEPKYILGVLVANQTALESLKKIESKLPVDIKSDIFF